MYGAHRWQPFSRRKGLHEDAAVEASPTQNCRRAINSSQKVRNNFAWGLEKKSTDQPPCSARFVPPQRTIIKFWMGHWKDNIGEDLAHNTSLSCFICAANKHLRLHRRIQGLQFTLCARALGISKGKYLVIVVVIVDECRHPVVQ